MIKSIYIKNFVIIDELRLELNKGLNIFIGETGAGKSIIMNAIDLLSGKRGDSAFIQKGKDKAILEATFSLDDVYRDRLASFDIDYDDEMIVYRLLSESKNIIRINNQTVTLNILKAIFEDRVDIHSQNDSQYLFKNKNQLAIIDRIGDHDEVLNKVQELYEERKALFKRYDELKKREESPEDIEYYEYQLNELKNADLKLEEEEELERFLKNYHNIEKFSQKLNDCIDRYTREGGVSDGLYMIIKNLNEEDDKIQEIAEQINDHYASLDDKIEELKGILASLDVSSERIESANVRLNEIRRLKRKYRRDLKELLNYIDELNLRIDENLNRSKLLKEMEEAIQVLDAQYAKYAQDLSNQRKEAALRLCEEVVEATKGLELKYFDFAINFNKCKDTALGNDDVSFMICINKGQDMSPLNKSASGGEMSRILLALKTVLNKLMQLDLVVFDEIDTGVSGKAALAVGEKMAKIACDTQVLVITHLAQVAAFGDVVYFVYKEDEGENTKSHIRELNDEAIIEELALMATGSKSLNALNMAKDLINEARSYK